MTTGLRERRKQETRLAISEVATRMFATHGFDEVTISQVADAAGVSKMTVTNYFPRKEDLVFDRAEVIIRSLADVIAARAHGEYLRSRISCRNIGETSSPRRRRVTVAPSRGELGERRRRARASPRSPRRAARIWPPSASTAQVQRWRTVGGWSGMVSARSTGCRRLLPISRAEKGSRRAHGLVSVG